MAQAPTSAATAAPLRLRANAKPTAPRVRTSGAVAVTSSRRLELGSARDAGGSTVDVKPDDVVCVELENGATIWMRADDLLRERGSQPPARGGEAPAWVIDGGPRVGAFGDAPQGASRGLLKIGIKVLELFGVDLKGKVAAELSGAFEARQLAGKTSGLHRISLGDRFLMTPMPNAPQGLDATRPLLLFLHGTASSTQGGFGKLWSTSEGDNGAAAAAARKALLAAYGDNAIAYEHRSLTESPIANALAVAALLPDGAMLDIVSHSRGGLVGELLCLAQRSPGVLTDAAIDELFTTDRIQASQIGLGPLDAKALKQRNEALAADATRLKALLALLDKKRLTVRRFVRVACPARGTTLASGRLDRWLSVLDWVSGSGIFGDVADFALAVVKQRTDPRTLPGLEAMMPGSATTRLLQLPGLVTQADLSVIAGDIEGDSRWGQLKLLALDWFYSAEHDLVVNTGSMSGGVQRPDGFARQRVDQGGDVSHFNYFSNRKTIAWLVEGLTRADGTDAGYTRITAAGAAAAEAPRWRAAVARSQDRSAAPKPIALMVPGTMGSALNVRGERVWLHYWRLLKGGLEDIGMGQPEVQPVELLDDFYGPLLLHLTRTHRVEIHPYDWRQSILTSAQGLAERLATLMDDAERSKQPLHIVAHSLGGLVSRLALAGPGQQVLRRMAQLPGSKLLMLGTPNQGSYEAVRWLTGFNPTQGKLALLDFKHGTQGIIDIVRRFPGLVELLPFDQEPNPWAERSVWQQLKDEINGAFKTVEEPVLRAARATWAKARAASPDKNLMIYVAGQARATVIGHQVVDDVWGQRKIEWLGTTEGDGTVSWASGRLPDVPMYYAPDTSHDELCANDDDRRIFRGYTELLLQGRTDQLPSTPPGQARAAGQPAVFVIPDLPLADSVPDEAQLRGAGFGGSRRRKPRADTAGSGAPVRLSVVHGDLAYATHPVVVGHYMGDTIVSAERALDKRLQGALSRRLDLGLYPGRVGTHAVFFNEQVGRKPAGAVVVGLGQVGSLTAARLETGVRDAMLEHAMAAAQRRRQALAALGSTAQDSHRARFSCLLVGTGANHLNVRDSIEAIVRGALAANRRLEETQLDGQVLIDEIEFVELFEDLAIGAARELAALVATREFDGRVLLPHRGVAEGPGRRRRGHFSADASWDQRVEITLDNDNQRLRFVLTADRARAEESQATGQLALAEAFVQAACTQTQRDANVAQTLFEMLLPVGLRETAIEERGIVLLLDAQSARYPWELLEDRWSRSGRPPALAGGMVRQFKTATFRERPAYAVGNTAFVVGNPDLQGDPHFPDLPGARREGEAVAEVLRQQGFKVRDSIDQTTSDIVSGLHADAWRLLHLAGHGEHEFPVAGGKTRSGMVIGNNQFLTPGDVQQLRHVPELVFINCCHLGKTSRSDATPAPAYNRLAANLGEEFINMGVRAVICAGWAVDDDAALTFARVFYERLFEGARFADAVRAARTAVHEGHPAVNTWGAYQCYGDPAYRLVRNDGGVVGTAPEPFVAPRELVMELANLREWCRVQLKERDEAATVAALRERIDGLQQRIPPAQAVAWLARADVAAELGFAYGEARLFEEAVQWFDKALSAEHGDCPVRAAEQCANFRARLAAERWQARVVAGTATPKQRTAAVNEIAGTIAELQAINRRGATCERWVLLGSAHKRLAQVLGPGATRDAAILEMAKCYRSAMDMKKKGQQDEAYLLTNWGVACLLAYKPGDVDWRPALRTRCQALVDSLAAQECGDADGDGRVDFWDATAPGDLGLVLLLADEGGDGSAHVTLARQAYANALSRGASPREASSLRENLDFLIEMKQGGDAKLLAALAEIRAGL